MMQPKLDTVYKEGNTRSVTDFEHLSYGMALEERPYTAKSSAFQDKPHKVAKCNYSCCTNVLCMYILLPSQQSGAFPLNFPFFLLPSLKGDFTPGKVQLFLGIYS